MKFQFSFQKVLDFKEKEKDLAQEEFGTIKLQQLELQEQIEELESVKDKFFNQYDEVDRKSIWEILQLQQEIDHVSVQKKRLENQSKKIFQEVEQKHQVLIEKTQEAKMWKQWKVKSKDSFQKQLERKEQGMLDEMAVLRYSRRI
ncbi:flagellar export protein FliJ [Neobacillus ginsengisoli]|uniref:Flagellar FliJ protein n=1 Tax=Neobacillus ginsengisoli TaxID=904295 RepID=A0ABT9XVG0_9BACI|nr:flagellar FliJ family protein [Neobacillus ginsengisoli]MDQ0199550.1 flagellar FliJ protein [Neobacillus ginsengisoli]